jgi:transcriptional regulator with GAF, ATPase, and Fis domain
VDGFVADCGQSIPKISRSITDRDRPSQKSETIQTAAAPKTPQFLPSGVAAAASLGGDMTSESILGLELDRSDSGEQQPSESTTVDVRLNTLRETVLQLLDEVESLAISRPVDIKHGARFSDEVKQFEVSLIRTALGRTSGSQTRAAKLLGLKPTTLNAKIKRYGIMA